MSNVLFIWFNDLKATRNYCIFGKKLKFRTKQVFLQLLFCAMFWKATYIYYVRFRLRKKIHNQLPSLERFLETISSIWCNLWKCRLSQTSAIQCPVLANESSFHTPFLKLSSTMLAPPKIKSKTDEHSQIYCLQTSSFLGRNVF